MTPGLETIAVALITIIVIAGLLGLLFTVVAILLLEQLMGVKFR